VIEIRQIVSSGVLLGRDAVPCNDAIRYQCFGVQCCRHLQSAI